MLRLRRLSLATLVLALVATCAVAQPALLWSARYDSGGEDRLGPGAPFRVDAAGGVTLAGRSGAGFLLLRYKADGAQDRVRLQTPSPDFVQTYVSVDGEGRALWAGSAQASPLSVTLLLRLTFDGDPEPLSSFARADPWSQIPIGEFVATGLDGSVFLAYQVIGRFGLASNSVRKIGAGGWDVVVAPVLSGVEVQLRVAPDPQGGALVTTMSASIRPQLQKVDPSGSLAFGRSLDSGPGVPNLIAIDGAGVSIVTGRSAAGDFQTLKLDAAGTDQWQRTFDGAGHGADAPTGLATDMGGNVLVTGSSVGVGGDLDFLTVKYDTAGNLLWARTYNGGGDDAPAGLAVDAGGNAWVTGVAGADVFTIKYDPSGNPLFSHRFTSPGPPTVAGVVLDSWGNATVAFSAAGDIFVLRYGEAPTKVGPLTFQTVDPCRAFDSRDPALGGPDPLTGPSDRTIPLAGLCGVPATAKAVSLNVTAVGSTQPGNLVLFPASQTAPLTSVVNYSTGQTRANNATVGLGTDAALALRVNQSGGSVHVLVDVVGYWQ